MISSTEIRQIVEAYIAQDPALFLVEASVSPQNRIVVTIDSDETVDISLCVALSKHIESALDRDIEDFELEVGSAGIGSPITTDRQWQKYVGEQIEVLLTTGMKEEGLLISADADRITLEVVRRVKPEGSKRKKDVSTDLVLAKAEIKRACYKVNV
ncbi:MAG: ribosome assembly cofactor RimP [Porphyromonas sp.]|nr:ribosome assembly cofactor RimP [Porphyromonas sp.]